MFTLEEQELLLALVCNYIDEYVESNASAEYKRLLLSILHKLSVYDDYYTKILGG